VPPRLLPQRLLLSNVRKHPGLHSSATRAASARGRRFPFPAASVDRRGQRESSVHVWFPCQPLTDGGRQRAGLSGQHAGQLGLGNHPKSGDYPDPGPRRHDRQSCRLTVIPAPPMSWRELICLPLGDLCSPVELARVNRSTRLVTTVISLSFSRLCRCASRGAASVVGIGEGGLAIFVERADALGAIGMDGGAPVCLHHDRDGLLDRLALTHPDRLLDGLYCGG
jgi:hypothetical protein